MGGFCWLRTCRRGSTSGRASGTLQRIRLNVCNGRCGIARRRLQGVGHLATGKLQCSTRMHHSDAGLRVRFSALKDQTSWAPLYQADHQERHLPNPYTGGNPAQTYVIMPPQAEFLPRPYGEQGLVIVQKIPLQNSGRSPQIPMEGRVCRRYRTVYLSDSRSRFLET